MTEHRLTVTFFGLSQRRFNTLAKRIDALVAEALGDEEYEVYTSPGGPSDWAASDVDIRLDGIRAARAAASKKQKR